MRNHTSHLRPCRQAILTFPHLQKMTWFNSSEQPPFWLWGLFGIIGTVVLFCFVHNWVCCLCLVILSFLTFWDCTFSFLLLLWLRFLYILFPVAFDPKKEGNKNTGERLRLALRLRSLDGLGGLGSEVPGASFHCHQRLRHLGVGQRFWFGQCGEHLDHGGGFGVGKRQWF